MNDAIKKSEFTNKDHKQMSSVILGSSKPVNKTAEEQYLDILRELLVVAEETGVTEDRTGTGRVRVFGRDIRCDLSDGTVPIITTRKINTEHGIQELLWMISGSSNIKDLHDSTKPIWNSWAIEEKHIDAFIAKFFKDFDKDSLEVLKKQLVEKHTGSLGNIYGKFWRNNPSTTESVFLPFDDLTLEDVPSDKAKLYSEEYDELIYFAKVARPDKKIEESDVPTRELYIKRRYLESNDQLSEIIRNIKKRPFSARHVMSVWVPDSIAYEFYTPHENVLLGRGALAPCHILSQFFVSKGKDGKPDKVSLRMYQRSSDIFLGVCTNLNFYAVLLHLVAHCCGLKPGELIWTSGDTHAYFNHLEAIKEQLTRTPYPSPKVKINPDVRDIFAIKREDIEILDYQHHPAIKAKVSV